MKLSPAQIERLYQFTQQHYVEWYDLQTELVDHLANAIEAQFHANPNLSFEEALKSEFKKFGVFGFMDVVEKRQSAMWKKYTNIVWKHFLEFFQLPQILITIASFIGTYFFLKYLTHAYEIYIVIAGILLITTLYNQIVFVLKQNRKAKKGEKKWLFEEIIKTHGNSSFLFLLPIQIISNSGKSSSEIFTSTIGLIIASMVLVSYYIFSYVMLKIIPSKANEYLSQTYPEYRFQKV